MLSNCQSLLQTITVGIFMLDVDGNITYCNPAASAITGYSAQELLLKPLSFIYNYKGDTTKLDYELGLALKKGSLISEGWKTKKGDGKFWAEMILSPLYDDQNKWTGYSCILHDISDKKRKELEVRENEERFRLMVEGIQDYSIFMMDPHGYIMSWNEGAKRITGYNPDEIIGKHFSIFYRKEDAESKKPEKELKIAIETGRYEEEGWRVKKNGSIFWANIAVTALYNEQNALIGLSKVTLDTTERKKNEEALLQSEERYRLLVEQVADYGIFMMDEKGRIISWNAGAKKIKGYTANEIIGKYFSIFYPEEDILKGKPADELKIARAEGKYEEEGWRIRKDGSRFWANIVITAVYNKDGSLLGFSKVTRDLTERKEAEKALRESYNRYRLIANQLKVSNTELSDANEELEQFTSIVSHDLQEPVRTIKSFLQLLDMNLNERQTADLKNYIHKAITAANRMKELIQNVLQYSQLSKVEIVKETVSVNELFSEALQNIKTSVEASKAQITIENEVATVQGNRIQLVQLIQNLLTNAVKFSDTKTPEIKIKCRNEEGNIKFTISDNGIGIAENDVNKVFEIFRRLNTKKKYPGTGIGLAICKKIIDRHGGHIWAESKLGKGTTFYFTLKEETTERQHA
ncbi:PAS domain-containing sensor histidine kinase [Segetibacter koreensis]|uniref:PAS domain-containing sensor histidine kinase n=1 Tax=Segetibacter koreensis TaxID=398037 RepID=UPI00039CD783|nr:PAS domain-containing sensor histidine kinase [Segetibacter koreensis]